MSSTNPNLSPNTVWVLREEYQWSTALLHQLSVELPTIPAPNFGVNPPPETTQGSSLIVASAAYPSGASTLVAGSSLPSLATQHIQVSSSTPHTNFPSIISPPPLPTFTTMNTPNTMVLAGLPQPQAFIGTPSVLPSTPLASTAPVPAAFQPRGIPSGGFPTASVNARRNSSSLVNHNASNSWQTRSRPYEVLNIAPPTTRLGISRDHINSLEVLVFPSEVKIWII